MTGPPSEDAGEVPPLEESALDEFDRVEDDAEDFEDEYEPQEEPERRWPLGVMLAVVLGVWVGRAFYRLPDGLENLAGLALSIATAVIAAALYRRWVRRQFATARARRR